MLTVELQLNAAEACFEPWLVGTSKPSVRQLFETWIQGCLDCAQLVSQVQTGQGKLLVEFFFHRRESSEKLWQQSFQVSSIAVHTEILGHIEISRGEYFASTSNTLQSLALQLYWICHPKRGELQGSQWRLTCRKLR